MAKFKVGDVVAVIKTGYGFGSIPVKNLTISEVSEEAYFGEVGYKFKETISNSFGNGGGWVGGESFELVKRAGQKEEDNMKSWKFNTTAPEYDINWYEIAKDVTKQNPVLLMQMDAEENNDMVAVHNMLLNKADVFFEPFEEALECDEGFIVNNATIFQVPRNKFEQVIKWAKAAKKAKYPEAFRNKGIVTVSQPSI